jgi:hypothetical protein
VRSALVGLDWAFQWAPPSVVTRIVPVFPTAQPCDAPAKQTPVRSFVVPLDWMNQFDPEVLVLRIVPEVPTAQPLVWVRNIVA